MSNFEIERKFLMLPLCAERLMQQLGVIYQIDTLEQFYIKEANKPNSRYRKKNDSYIHTVKSGEGLVRHEREVYITKEKYESKLSRATGRVITKKRYSFELEGYTYELDIFEGALLGFVYLEIEFGDEESAKNFKLTPMLSHLLYKEVTELPLMSNYALSQEAYLPSLFKGAEFDLYTPTAMLLAKSLQQSAKNIEFVRQQLIIDPSNKVLLHDFRVHLRKIRALLSLFEDQFVHKPLKVLKKNLKELMRATNAKRDIDVAIVSFDALLAQQPKELCKTIKKLLISFEKKSTKLSGDIANIVVSKKLYESLEKLQGLTYESEFFELKSSEPIVINTFGRIHEQLKTIALRVHDLEHNQTNKSYHRLRIDFKKLRYMLNMYDFLHNEQKFIAIQNEFKTIQNELGEIQDIDMQMLEIEHHLESDKNKEQVKKILKKMQQRREELQESFMQHYQIFESYENGKHKIEQVFMAN